MTKWEFLCTVRGIDCTEIQPPLIVYVPLGGPWGLYHPPYNPDVVFVEYTLNETDADVVSIHEMSHYLDYQVGKLSLTDEGYLLDELCQSEGTGFNVANAWVAYKGYDQSFAWYDWIKGYPHCQ